MPAVAAMTDYVIPLSASQAGDPASVGPKAANLAALGHAGLPIPDGFCLVADAYRAQVAALGLETTARGVFGSDEGPRARRHALDMKLDLMDKAVPEAISGPLLAARQKLLQRNPGARVVVCHGGRRAGNQPSPGQRPRDRLEGGQDRRCRARP